MMNLRPLIFRFCASAMLPALLVTTALPARAQDAAEMLLRIDRLENLVRQLNGQVEQASNQNRRLEEQVKRFQSDTDFRFREIEQGRGAARREPNAPSNPAAPPARQQRGDAFDPSAAPGAAGAPQTLGSPGSGTQPRPRQQGSAAVANPGQIIAGDENALGRDPRQPTDLAPGARGAQTTASLPPPGTGTPREIIAQGRQQLTDSEYEAAELTFKEFIRTRPRDALVAEATLGLGDSFYQRQRWREAAEQFVDVTTKFPKSARAPEAEFKLGISLRGLGATKEACDVLSNHGRKYPTASAAIKQGVAREMQRSRCAT
jgi:tol-pal system protein YbgF